MSNQIYFTYADLKLALDNNYIDQLTDENRDNFFDKINIDELHKAARGTFELYNNFQPILDGTGNVPEFIRDKMLTFAIYRAFRRRGYAPEVIRSDYLEIMDFLQSGQLGTLLGSASGANNPIRGNMNEEDLEWPLDTEIL